MRKQPFYFQQKHIDDLQPLLPQTRIILVDGEMLSWYEAVYYQHRII